MSKLFITESDEVRVDLFVSETANGRVVAWTDEADRPEAIEQCEKYQVTFREPNYNDTVGLIDLATSMTSEGEFAMNLSTVRMQRVAMLVKDWDFVDESGNRVEPSLETIQSLNPVVALALADGLERALKLFDPEDTASVEKATEMLEEANRLADEAGE